MSETLESKSERIETLGSLFRCLGEDPNREFDRFPFAGKQREAEAAAEAAIAAAEAAIHLLLVFPLLLLFEVEFTN